MKERHGKDYHIYNLSGRPYDIRKFDGQVSDFVNKNIHLGLGGPSFTAYTHTIQAL